MHKEIVVKIDFINNVMKMPLKIKRTGKPVIKETITYLADPNTFKIDLYYITTDNWLRWCKTKKFKIYRKYEYIGRGEENGIRYYRAR